LQNVVAAQLDRVGSFAGLREAQRPSVRDEYYTYFVNGTPKTFETCHSSLIPDFGRVW